MIPRLTKSEGTILSRFWHKMMDRLGIRVPASTRERVCKGLCAAIPAELELLEPYLSAAVKTNRFALTKPRRL